jgi:hypothetical protein
MHMHFLKLVLYRVFHPQHQIPSTVLQAVISVNGSVTSGAVQLSWLEGVVSSYYPTLNYNIY